MLVDFSSFLVCVVNGSSLQREGSDLWGVLLHIVYVGDEALLVLRWFLYGGFVTFNADMRNLKGTVVSSMYNRHDSCNVYLYPARHE